MRLDLPSLSLRDLEKGLSWAIRKRDMVLAILAMVELAFVLTVLELY